MTVKAAIHFLLIIVISVVLAPVIGGIAFFAVRAAIDLATTGLDDIKGLFVIVVIGTYAVGGPIALLAGILVAIINLWRLPSLPVILAAILAANVAVLVFQPVIGFGWGGFFINLASSMFAGTICWLLFRRHLSAR